MGYKLFEFSKFSLQTLFTDKQEFSCLWLVYIGPAYSRDQSRLYEYIFDISFISWMKWMG